MHIAKEKQDNRNYGKAQGRMPAICTACLDNLPGKSAKHHRHTESKAAPYPCIVIPWSKVPLTLFVPIHTITPTSKHGTVHHLGKVAFCRIVATEMHWNPIYEHEQTGGNDLCTYSKMQHQQGGNEIARCYRLKRVAIETEMLRVKAKEISLHHHAKDEKDEKTFQYLFVYWPPALCHLVL